MPHELPRLAVAVLLGPAFLLLVSSCEVEPPLPREIQVIETVRLQMPGREGFENVSDELALRSPAGMLWDGERLFVSDVGRGSVVVIDPEGRLETILGRSGSGPGEFNRPEGLWSSGGELVVFDAGNARLSRWDAGAATLLEEHTFSPEAGVFGTVAWIEQFGYLIPTSVADSLPVRVVSESGASQPLTGWPERTWTYPRPLVIDLIAHRVDRTVVLDNLGSRLLVGDGSGTYEFELALPGGLVDSIVALLESRRSPNDPSPLLPQLGRFLSIDSEGVATLLFIQPVQNIVGLSIDLASGEATQVEVVPGVLALGATPSEVTSLVKVGSCYFVGSSAGVQELCGGNR
jgi:hypothetical protein